MLIKVCLTSCKKANINFIKGHFEDIENIGLLLVQFVFFKLRLLDQNEQGKRRSLSIDKKNHFRPKSHNTDMYSSGGVKTYANKIKDFFLWAGQK